MGPSDSAVLLDAFDGPTAATAASPADKGPALSPRLPLTSSLTIGIEPMLLPPRPLASPTTVMNPSPLSPTTRWWRCWTFSDQLDATVEATTATRRRVAEILRRGIVFLTIRRPRPACTPGPPPQPKLFDDVVLQRRLSS